MSILCLDLKLKKVREHFGEKCFVSDNRHGQLDLNHSPLHVSTGPTERDFVVNDTVQHASSMALDSVRGLLKSQFHNWIRR
jgi:hypothetical protein